MWNKHRQKKHKHTRRPICRTQEAAGRISRKSRGKTLAGKTSSEGETEAEKGKTGRKTAKTRRASPRRNRKRSWEEAKETGRAAIKTHTPETFDQRP